MNIAADQIARSLVQVRLTISQWDGAVASEQLSTSVARTNNAERGSVSTKLFYLPPSYYKPITLAASRLRSYWNSATLPWDNDAWRIVPSSTYMSLMDTAAAMKLTFDTAVENLISNYDEVMRLSKKRLAGLYLDKKFPSIEDLRSKYDIRFLRQPVVLATDVRIDGLGDEAQEAIRADVAAQLKTQIGGAILSMIEQLKVLATDIIDRMQRIDDGVKCGTLINKIRKTCDTIEGLNITNDPIITESIDRFRKLGKYDPDTVKLSRGVQDTLNSEAEDILSLLDNFKG